MHTCINGYHQNVTMETSAYIPPLALPSAPLQPTQSILMYTAQKGLTIPCSRCFSINYNKKILTN